MLRLSRSKLKLLLLSSLFFWVPLIVFSGIASEVSERTPLPGDVAILNFIHHNFSSSLSGVFLFATNVGSAIGIVIITMLLVGLLIHFRKRRLAATLLFSVAGAAAANFIIKLLFRRERPALWDSIIHEQSFSFPSGHAMASSALVFALIFITWRTRFRWPSIILGGIFMLVVGLSRLYFGVHYPSDVVAGWLASLIWTALVATIITRPGIDAFAISFMEKLKLRTKRQ